MLFQSETVTCSVRATYLSIKLIGNAFMVGFDLTSENHLQPARRHATNGQDVTDSVDVIPLVK